MPIYGYNNPVKYTDPSGHEPEDWFNDDWKSEFRAARDGADPTIGDYAYRFLTMAAASGIDIVSSLMDSARATAFLDGDVAGEEEGESENSLPGGSVIDPDGEWDIPPLMTDWLSDKRTPWRYTFRPWDPRTGIRILDPAGGGKRGGGRVFHIHTEAKKGWHFNADKGPLQRFNETRFGPIAARFANGAPGPVIPLIPQFIVDMVMHPELSPFDLYRPRYVSS